MSKNKTITPRTVFSSLGTAFPDDVSDNLYFELAERTEDKPEAPTGLFISTSAMPENIATGVLRAIPADDKIATSALLEQEVDSDGNKTYSVGINLPGIQTLEELRDSLPANTPENVAHASRQIGSVILESLDKAAVGEAIVVNSASTR